MTGDEFSIYLEQLDDDLDRLDLSDAMKECAELLQDGFAGNFARAEDEDGAPWPPHAESTVRRYGEHPLLILTRTMMDAATEEGSAGNITRTTERTCDVGVDGGLIEYAATHQFGGGNVPQRQYVYANEETLDACAEAIGDDVEFQL